MSNKVILILMCIPILIVIIILILLIVESTKINIIPKPLYVKKKMHPHSLCCCMRWILVLRTDCPTVEGLGVCSLSYAVSLIEWELFDLRHKTGRLLQKQARKKQCNLLWIVNFVSQLQYELHYNLSGIIMLGCFLWSLDCSCLTHKAMRVCMWSLSVQNLLPLVKLNLDLRLYRSNTNHKMI